MENNIYVYILVMKTNNEYLSSFVFVLCSLCDPCGDDLSFHNERDSKSDSRRRGADYRNSCRMEGKKPFCCGTCLLHNSAFAGICFDINDKDKINTKYWEDKHESYSKTGIPQT